MTKIFNKLKKPCSWHIFGPFSQFSRQKKIFFSRKSGSVCATSYGFLAPCQNLEKTNDTIPRKRPERRKDGRKDGKTERPKTLPTIARGPIREKTRSNCFLQSFLDVNKSSKSNFKNYFLYSIFLQSVTFVLRKFITL